MDNQYLPHYKYTLSIVYKLVCECGEVLYGSKDDVFIMLTNHRKLREGDSEQIIKLHGMEES